MTSSDPINEYEVLRVVNTQPRLNSEVGVDSLSDRFWSGPTLGRVVRQAWVEWAETQPDPKPSWLVSYDQLSDADKQADMKIGCAVVAFIRGELGQPPVDTNSEAVRLLQAWHDALLLHDAPTTITNFQLRTKILGILATLEKP